MRSRYIVSALAVALAHGALFLALVSEQIARAEQVGVAQYNHGALDVAVAVLGAPVFYVLRPRWTFWLRPYLGDDTWIIVLLATLNALCWGAISVGLVWWWRRRRIAPAI